MKKKIKDLTAEECERICDTKKVCENCPLNFDNSAICMIDLKDIDTKDLKARQEQEIDIYFKENS